MKKLLFTGLFAALIAACFAQKPRMVVFYNLENFFDTINDPDTNDEEFLPDGARAWNTYKYNRKLSNVERVFFDIAAINHEYPAVIGVSEIENRSVLEDIVATPKLSPASYRIVHYDSPDRRGVDVAFFYRPDIFKLEGSHNFPVNFPDAPNFRTRDVVAMWGTIDDVPYYFMVAHWPSRLGGKEASSPRREFVAQMMRDIADSVTVANPATRVVMMGDFNDDAIDKSIVEVIGAKGDIKKVADGDYYNPYIKVLKSGRGTLAYQDKWNLFDNIVVSGNLVTGSDGGPKIWKNANDKFYGYIFSPSYLKQQEGRYAGYPLRTFVGSNFQGGFSDHFPVYIYIE